MVDHKKRSRNPWHTKEWKEKRKEKLGDRCARCGNTEQPLVIQHLSHPPKAAETHHEIMNRILLEAIEQGKEKQIEEVLLPYKEVYTKEACPKCKLMSIRSRKYISPKWHCIPCGFEFEVPDRVFNIRDPAVKKIISDYWKALYQKYKEEIIKRTEEAKEENHKKYMSMEGTITLCQKCAFLEDIKGKVLCNYCKKNYHPKTQTACEECILKAFDEAQKQMYIGDKDARCSHCFWFAANPKIWPTFRGTARQMLEVKQKKCLQCKEGLFDEFKEFGAEQ